MESGGPIVFYSRMGVISSIQVCFGLIMVFFFDGLRVERWWKSNEQSNKSFLGVAQLW